MFALPPPAKKDHFAAFKFLLNRPAKTRMLRSTSNYQTRQILTTSSPAP